jgi:hypothetical protein
VILGVARYGPTHSFAVAGMSEDPQVPAAFADQEDEVVAARPLPQ